MSKRRRLWLLLASVPLAVLLIVILLLPGVVLPLLPSNQYQSTDRYYCLHCGAWKGTTELGMKKSRVIFSTTTYYSDSPLSKWYAAHLGTCSHAWRRCHVSTDHYFSLLGLFRLKQCSESGSGHTPSLIRLSDSDKAILASKLAQSPAAARKYISERLSPDYPDLLLPE